MKSTIIAVIALIGIGCLCFAGFGAPVLRDSAIDSQNQMTLSDSTSLHLNTTYAKPFHLDFGQSLQLLVTMNVNITPPQDNTLRVLIVSADNYVNWSDKVPGFLPGLPVQTYSVQYSYTTTAQITNPTETTYLNTSTQGVEQHLEFMGGVNGQNLYSIPGDYYVCIWTNDTTYNDGGTVTFNLQVSLSGLNNTLGPVFMYAGLGCLVLAGVLVVLKIRQEER